MWAYILKRLFFFIPTLILISLAAFLLNASAPGDPVSRLLNMADKEGALGKDLNSTNRLKQEVRQKFGLNLPLFYFDIGTLADPDSLFLLPDKSQRQMITRLSRKYGDPEAAISYYRYLQVAYLSHSGVRPDSLTMKRYNQNEIKNAINESRFTLLSLMEISDDEIIAYRLDSLSKLYSLFNFLTPVENAFRQVEDSYFEMIANPVPWRTYIPVFHWNGFDNQYHRWITGIILRGDFGVSYQNQQPIMNRIWERFHWSFWLSFISVVIAYLVSIPIGIYAAYKKDTLFDRVSSVVLFILYSLPNFFVGTLLLVMFANPDFLNWFPESGVKNPITFNEDWNQVRKIWHYLPYLVLPVITYTYSSFAFLSRQMRVGMVDILHQDYIRTARAKGLTEKKVILKHALRNSLLPIITIFANIFPLAVGGSVIVETIFSIPGMGMEIYQSILNNDYPMIITVFTLIGFLTLCGYLVSDILYAIVDPRISFK